MLRMKNFVAALFVAASLQSCAATHSNSTPVVSTADGDISGVQKGDVTAFLGVPFAAPPVGPNRWRRPQAVVPWTGVRNARAFAASCMQPSGPPASEGPYTPEFTDTPPGSEDCLYLNVWTAQKPSAKKPVFVWIHGGGFNGGSGAVPIYDGAELAKRNIVVVSMNYRLGPFGFLAHPALTAEDPNHSSGDYGLLDQLAALRWVQRNIERFGGDPENVTIAGQSAGAASVNDLVVSPLGKGLFQRAIAESGSGMGIGAPKLERAEQDGIALANYLRAKTADELRGIPADKVLSGVAVPWETPKPGQPKIMFAPIIDGYVLPYDPSNPEGKPAAPVPLLTGFNTDEAPPAGETAPADFERSVRASFGAHADEFLRLYPHSTTAESAESAKLLARDRYLASLILWTDRRTQSSHEPIFRYLFTKALPVASGRSFGAFHTAEVPYLFGNLNTKLRPYTSADRTLSRLVQDYWLNFARTGNPNGTGLPTWAPAGGPDHKVMIIGTSSDMGAAVSNPARLEAFRRFIEDGGSLSVF